MAALSAPAEEPATRRTGNPPSMKASAAPASHAPLAPPPDSTSAAGASSGPRSGSHAQAVGPTSVTVRTEMSATRAPANGRADDRGASVTRTFY